MARERSVGHPSRSSQLWRGSVRNPLESTANGVSDARSLLRPSGFSLSAMARCGSSALRHGTRAARYMELELQDNLLRISRSWADPLTEQRQRSPRLVRCSRMEATMRTTLLCLGIVGCVVFGVASAPNASPLSATRGASNPEAGGVQTVDYRRCWWDDGRRICRYVHEYRNDDWRYRHRDWRWRHRSWY
jgi:hypothetical protein